MFSKVFSSFIKVFIMLILRFILHHLHPCPTSIITPPPLPKLRYTVWGNYVSGTYGKRNAESRKCGKRT